MTDETDVQSRSAAEIIDGYGLLGATVGAFFSIMLARIVISPVVPEIVVSLAASRSSVGLALTGMWAMYALAQFASGVLGSVYGERRVIVVAVALGAVVAFPACLLFLWRVDPTPPSADGRQLREQVQPRRLAGLLARPSIAFTVGVAVLVYFVWQSIYSFFPTFLVQHWGFSTGLAGVLFGAVFATTALSLPLLGRLSDALGRDVVLGVTFLALAGGLVVLVAGGSFHAAVVGCGLVAIGMGFPGVLNSRFMDHLGARERGHGFGLIRTINLLLGSLGSVVTGTLADLTGWTLAYGVLPVLLMVPLAMLAGNRLLTAEL